MMHWKGVFLTFCAGTLARCTEYQPASTTEDITIEFDIEIEPVLPSTAASSDYNAWSDAYFGTSPTYLVSTSQPTLSSTAIASSTSVDPSLAQSQSTSSASIPAGLTESPNSSSDSSYQSKIIKHHNLHRSNHSAPAIAWDSDLAEAAKALAEKCVFEHSSFPRTPNLQDYGQNIALGIDSSNVSSIVSDMWYNSEMRAFDPYYGQASPAFNGSGHFTQVVWKSSTRVGCATVDCTGRHITSNRDNSPYFTVCNYQSPGNSVGGYATNVGRPRGSSVVSWRDPPTVDSQH